MTVVGSAEFEIRANRSKLANDLREQEREVKASLDRTERETNQKLTRYQRASRINLARQVPDVLVTAGMGMSPAMVALRWLRLFGQHGGLAKVGSDSDYAASLRSGLALSGASPG